MGSEGDDYIDGGDGYDTIDYSGSPNTGAYRFDGVDVDVGSSSFIHIGEGGHAEGDILVNIEVVIGSAHNDRIDVSDSSSREPRHRAL